MHLTIRSTRVLHVHSAGLAVAALLLLSACGPAPEVEPPPESVDGDSASVEPMAVTLEEPYVDRGVCPFECCTYQEWIARDSIQAYRAERDTSEAAFTLAPGERFDGLTGNVHLDRVGVAVVRDTLRVNEAGPQGPALYLPGDTVYILSPVGEGFFHLWHQGEVAEGYGFWSMNPMEAVGPQGELLREPVWEWWAQVRNAEGQTGWLNMSRLGGRIGGVDACGGP